MELSNQIALYALILVTLLAILVDIVINITSRIRRKKTTSCIKINVGIDLSNLSDEEYRIAIKRITDKVNELNSKYQ